jgi:hypothetical protein
MSGFLKSLLGRGAQKPTPASTQQTGSISYEQLEPLPFEEVMKFAQTLRGNAPAGTLTSLVRKFYMIGLFDNHVPAEHRNASLKMARPSSVSVLIALEN